MKYKQVDGKNTKANSGHSAGTGISQRPIAATSDRPKTDRAGDDVGKDEILPFKPRG